MIFTAKKNYTHVAIHVQAFRGKPKRLRLFSHRNCLHDQILSENICRNIITTVTNYSICMEQTSFMSSKCDSKGQILYALHKLRKQRTRKTSIVQADSKVTFNTITSSIRLLPRPITRVWPVNT